MKIIPVIMFCALGVVFGGSFRDSRDGKVYKTVKIGNQIWMAENLNYEVDNGYGSWCYANEYRNCKKYGRLYTYYAAMNACPSGWHLPSESEWKVLFDYVGGMQVANYELRSKDGWGYKGEDRYKFNVLPAGSYNHIEGVMYMDGKDRWEFGYLHQWAIFRTSSEKINYYFPGSYTNVVRDEYVDSRAGTSVRCIRDY